MNSIKRLKLTAPILAVAIMVSYSESASSNGKLNPELLTQLETSTKNICGEYQRSGYSVNSQFRGKLQGHLAGISKVLAKAGIDLEGGLKGDVWSNVIREKLGSELHSIRQCKTEVLKILIKRLPAPKRSNARSRSDRTERNFSNSTNNVSVDVKGDDNFVSFGNQGTQTQNRSSPRR